MTTAPPVIAYIDTSALLRIVLPAPGALDDRRSYEALVSSGIIAVEGRARSIDLASDVTRSP